MEKTDIQIDRRKFLKIVGLTTTTVTAGIYGCKLENRAGNEKNSQGVIPVDKMTYRTFPGNSDRVSLLGYGCMRWPTIPSPDGKGDLIDQETVNELVDYAIAHGVNYFDTSPVYVQGWSEKATGIALKRIRVRNFILQPNCLISLTIRGKVHWLCIISPFRICR